jgi:hypothetical protein
MSINIDETLYPLSLADHKPQQWPMPPNTTARPQTPVEVALGLLPGEELDTAWYRGTSPLQEQEREARMRAHYLWLKRL